MQSATSGARRASGPSCGQFQRGDGPAVERARIHRRGPGTLQAEDRAPRRDPRLRERSIGESRRCAVRPARPELRPVRGTSTSRRRRSVDAASTRSTGRRRKSRRFCTWRGSRPRPLAAWQAIIGSQSGNRNMQTAGLIGMGIGIAAMIFAATAIDPGADLRAWTNAPGADLPRCGARGAGDPPRPDRAGPRHGRSHPGMDWRGYP
jgi:hypothetical protein